MKELYYQNSLVYLLIFQLRNKMETKSLALTTTISLKEALKDPELVKIYNLQKYLSNWTLMVVLSTDKVIEYSARVLKLSETDQVLVYRSNKVPRKW